jgi:hypothetical protein
MRRSISTNRKADVFDGGVVVAGLYLGQNLAEVLVDGGPKPHHPFLGLVALKPQICQLQAQFPALEPAGAMFLEESGRDALGPWRTCDNGP